MSIIVYLILLVVLFVFVSAYYSGIETGIYSISRIRLRFKVEERDGRALRIKQLLSDPQAIISTTLIGHNIAIFVASGLFEKVVGQWGIQKVRTEFVSTLILTPFIFIFAEMLPKNIFRIKADKLVYKFSSILQVSMMAFTPVIIFFKIIYKLLDVLFKSKEKIQDLSLSRKRLKYILMEGREGGVLTSYQNMMAKNIMDLGRIPVGDVMIKIDNVKMVDVSHRVGSVKKIVRETGFSRIPVFEGRKTKVLGIINIFDVIYSGQGDDEPLDPFIRKATRLIRSMPIDDALFKLQIARSQMGIVVDKDDRSIGIVTIKDLVEEIVGELKEW